MITNIETKHLKTRWIHLFNKNMHQFFINKNVLDIGCLDGYSTNQFLKNNAKLVVGIDIEPKYIDKARLEYPNIDFDIQDAENIDLSVYFKNFDVISCLGLIYLLKSPTKFLNDLSVQNDVNTIIIETVYNNSKTFYNKNFSFLNVDNIKNIFLSNGWKMSLEKQFIIEQIDNQINDYINFKNRIVFVFERMP